MTAPQPSPACDAARFFAPDGLLAAMFPGHEPRPQQAEMAVAVERALESRRHLVVEAGTGVGKSFAYLVPHILHALRAEKPVLVATNTILLQEQLVGKDIPNLQRILPVTFTAAIAKGRANYLCGARLRLAVEQPELVFEDEPGDVLPQLLAWYKKAEACDRSSVPFTVPEDVWSRVHCDDTCTKKTREEWPCHYVLARRRLAKATLVIANHALLAIDLKVRAAGAKVLPDADAIVIDEAHAFEKVALDQMGHEYNRRSGQRLLAEIQSDRRHAGLLLFFNAPDVSRIVSRARAAENEFFAEVSSWTKNDGRKEEDKLRVREPAGWSDAAARAFDELGDGLTDLVPLAKTTELSHQVDRLAQRCADRAKTLRALLQPPAGAVTWVERTGRQRDHTLRSVPVEVGPLLARTLFGGESVVTLTSATLRAGSAGFAPIRERLGIADADELAVGSPFDFREQATLVVARAVPEPGAGAAWEDALRRKIPLYLHRSDGRALVLFTSFGTMRRVREAVQAAWPRPILVQGEGVPRDRMIAKMKAEPGTVIFGVESFWHGVDVPGDALENVIITRLPFPNPSDPLAEARHELLESAGRSPFNELDLPEAILMFRQGFGRLIRTRSDHGIVVVLDSRLARKGYGKRFLAALPECRVEYDDEA